MARYGLKPLNKDPDRDSPGFAVCDIESFKGWINFAVIGLAWKSYDDDGNETEKRYEYFLTMAEFADFIFESEQPHEQIFAHFGGRYDFSFILKEYYFNHDKYHIGTIIPRGSGLLCFEVSTFTTEDVIPSWCNPDKDVFGRREDGQYLIRDRTITFRDSSAMLPFGLGSLTENFGVEHKKKEIDYDKITEVTPELLEYLEYDCWGLYDCLERYFRWDIIKAAGPAMTIASQSLRVFRTYMKKEIPALSPSADSFVRSSYIGGRTEIIKPFFEQCADSGLLKSYDVNSLYPFIMRSLSYPGGFKYETTFYKEDEMGFYDVEVEVPDMYIPVLGVRYKDMEDRLIFPTGVFRGCWSTLELNYAMSLGVKILKVYRGMIMHDIGPIFRDYIDHLYDMRKKSKKGSVDDILCKLIMNSTYGRFGLNLLREQLVLDQGQLGVTPFMDIPLSESTNETIRLAKQEILLETSYSNVGIAAWVTSGARIHMHKLILEAPEDMYYMDTDSLKTTHTYARNDADLGKLKLEYRSKRACFLLPKTYVEDTTQPLFKVFDESGKTKKLYDSDGKLMLDDKGRARELLTCKKLVMKGFDKKKIAHFTPEDFASCLEGDMKRLQATNPAKFAPLRSAIRKNEFLLLLGETPRQIRTRYNKRRVVKRAWSQVYDTEPLNIKDGSITNLDDVVLKKWKAATRESLIEVENDVIKQWKREAKANAVAEEYHKEKNGKAKSKTKPAHN